MDQQGLLLLLVAPSGTGKTTLINKLKKDFKFITSISYTTRQPREYEEDGKDYYFVSKDIFETMIRNNEFIEYAKVHNNYYGTKLKSLQHLIYQGKNILFEIDIQGAKNLHKKFSNICSIFILPPSLLELKNRLLKRKTENEKSLKIRLENAKKEIEQASFCTYIIMNDDLTLCYNELKSIVKQKIKNF